MPSMSEGVHKIEFEWGKMKGRGGTNKNVQFYESFTYDGLNYSLYDSVYLFKDDVAEPYIGKIVKIWEPANKSRKVKILWFFRPSEISSYIGGLQILKNELFLGTGAGSDGSGLDNINPLEAIAGKCNVVCISKDKRNRQPSPEELAMADFVFYRTFDVDKFTISDKLGEYISNFKVELLLNNENSQISNPLRIESDDKRHGGNVIATPEIEMVLQKKDTCKILAPVSAPGAVPMEREPGAELSLDKRKHLPLVNSDRAHEDSVEPSEKDNVCDGKEIVFKCAEVQKCSTANHKESRSTDHPKMDLDAGANNSSDKIKETSEENVAFGNHGLKNSLSTSGVDDRRSLDGRLFKKHKADDCSRSSLKLPVSASHGLLKSKRPVNSANELLVDRPHKKLKSAEAVWAGGKSNSSSKPISKMDTRVYGQQLLVTRRPVADSSKWFTGLPWEDTMKAAQEEGTIVLLQNLDPTYTSSEIEDVVWHSFRENCTAKILNCAGQAYVICRTKQAALRIVRNLEEGCLMLPNGRPLLGHVGVGHLPGKSSSFPGHLHIDRLKFSMQKDKRDAVSTSHCSQPNTLEYDMAMEWRLLQERSELMRKNLFKKQAEEVKKLKGNLKRKF
ncbi:hypothetical protein V2J09_009381 [Rumex salicifolius]